MTEEETRRVQAEIAKAIIKARRDALEEAAKVADAEGWGPALGPASSWETSHAEGGRDVADRIAASIRALIDKEGRNG